MSVARNFTVRISGNPNNISLLLNIIDAADASTLYPLTCLDGYHFEDATVTCDVDERGSVVLVSVNKSNIRGSL